MRNQELKVGLAVLLEAIVISQALTAEGLSIIYQPKWTHEDNRLF